VAAPISDATPSTSDNVVHYLSRHNRIRTGAHSSGSGRYWAYRECTVNHILVAAPAPPDFLDVVLWVIRGTGYH